MPRPSRRRYGSRFDDADADPLTGMANLADVMLVFACGLLTALGVSQLASRQPDKSGGVSLEQGKEVPELPRGEGGGLEGYESVGKVYRDAKSGKLVMIGD
jgi:hypothetical protein